MVEPFLSDETSKSGKITFVENDGVEIITEENQTQKHVIHVLRIYLIGKKSVGKK